MKEAAASRSQSNKQPIRIVTESYYYLLGMWLDLSGFSLIMSTELQELS